MLDIFVEATGLRLERSERELAVRHVCVLPYPVTCDLPTEMESKTSVFIVN